MAACEALPEVSCAGVAEDLVVFSLERLLEARLCRRLPWWRTQGFAPAPPDWKAELPSPWPHLPPGWWGSGRGWPRPFLEAPPEWGLSARTDWLLEQDGRPHLVLLGPPTPTLRLRARILGTLMGLRGHSAPGLGWQGLPPGGLSCTWLGEWPRVQPLKLPLASHEALASALETLRRDMEKPWPPARSAPRVRCWDCSASRLCADYE